MKPWSCAWRGTFAPPARALATSVSTCSRLLQATHVNTSLDLLVSAMVLSVKLVKNFSTSSITNRLSPRIMQVAFSSVNCGLNVYPRPVKKRTERFRSLTGRLTKICECMMRFLLVGVRSRPGGRGSLLGADLQLANGPHFDAAELRRRNLRGELDGFVEIARFEEIEARELLLGLGKGSVGDAELPVAHTHCGGGVHGMKRFRGNEMSAGSQRVPAGHAGFVRGGAPLFGREVDQAEVLHA